MRVYISPSSQTENIGVGSCGNKKLKFEIFFFFYYSVLFRVLQVTKQGHFHATCRKMAGTGVYHKKGKEIY